MIPEHTTPASSPWPQLLFPRAACRQCIRDVSLPTQATSSSQMSPLPWPKKALDLAVWAVPQSIALHTTWASLRPHSSSHTVPHTPSCRTSTLPEHWSVPLTSLSGTPPEDRSTQVKLWNISATIQYILIFCSLPAHERETPSHLPECSRSVHWEIELTLPEHWLVYPLSPLSPKLKVSWNFLGDPQLSSLHTTADSSSRQSLLQIFPQWPCWKTSTLPEQRSVPLYNLSDSGKQAVKKYCI